MKTRKRKRIDSDTPSNLKKYCLGEDIILGKELGRGEFGITYQITEDTVLKIVKLPNKQSLIQFENESRIQTELGNKHIAPAVHRFWTCKKFGFILMERLKYVYRDIFPDRGYEFENNPPIKIPSLDIQKAVVGALEKMILSGYIHQDNHGGNIGFNQKGQVRLFDFGFTIPIQQNCKACNLNQILGFSLYQLIEHLPLSAYDNNFYLDVIYLIRQDKYSFGTYITYFDTFRME